MSDTHVSLYANPAFTRLTGYELNELPNTSLPGSIRQWRVSATIPVENYGEVTLPKKNGTVVKLRVSESVIRLSDTTEGFAYTFVSFPNTGQAENGDKKFYELADASPAMIFLENSNEYPVFFNKSWLSYAGKTLQEQLVTDWKEMIHPDDLKALNELKTGATKGKSYSCECRLRKFDGLYRSIFIIGTPVISEAGVFNGYMSSCLDITEIKEAQTKILQLSNELNVCNEELEQFTYVTSHDLQEPLRMITAYVQLIQRNIEKGTMGTTAEFMDFVLNGTARMQLLITDLLKLSRVNRKAAPFTPVDVQEVLNVAMAHLAKKIKEKHARIERDAMPVILGDTFQLVTLFENLLDNALKFTSLSESPMISVSVQEENDKYIFEVKDNGIGIDNKFHKRIFAIFQRLHTRGEYEGTGIGLAVCKKIVERHGGDMWLKSTPGSGSSFYFSVKK